MLRIDYETLSPVDLKKTGLHIYADHPETDAWCMGYAFDDEEVQIWIAGEELPERIRKHVEDGGLVGAWNATFELQIWNKIMVPRYGWPVLAPKQCRCTMMMSGAMSLPLGLDQAAEAIGLDHKKDKKGYMDMLRMSKPRKTIVDEDTGEITYTWWNEPERMERLYSYCKQDVAVERAMAKKLKPLSRFEQNLWRLDQKINNRGVPMDIASVKAMQAWAGEERGRLNIRMKEVSGGAVKSCSDVVGLTTFAGVTSVAKAQLAEDISSMKKGPKRLALKLRREFAKTSVKKLEAILIGTSVDQRMRGIFQMYGAISTGRWGGRRVQPQNLTRPAYGVEHEEIERRIAELDFSSLQDVADCLRALFAAPEGEAFVCADFSSIEAMVIAWFSNQEDVLEVFRRGEDIYKHTATGLFPWVDYDEVNSEQRQLGKVACLALGFQGAVGAFNSMASNYGVSLPDQQVKNIVRKWRESNGRIVDFWYHMERGATKAITRKGTVVEVGMVSFEHRHGHLWMTIPSGRKLCFPLAKVSIVHRPWGSGLGITYMGLNRVHGVERLNTYGGKLVENCVQATARDILAEAIFRVERAGYAVVMHVHDELVAELPDGGSLEEFSSLMAHKPDWAKNIPLAAHGWVGRRYRKD